MKKYFCDKCGKEVDELDVNITEIYYQWYKPKYIMAKEKQEYCDDCYNEFKKILKKFNNIEIK